MMSSVELHELFTNTAILFFVWGIAVLNTKQDQDQVTFVHVKKSNLCSIQSGMIFHPFQQVLGIYQCIWDPSSQTNNRF